MEDKPFKVNHLADCMLYEFPKGSNLITTVKNNRCLSRRCECKKQP